MNPKRLVSLSLESLVLLLLVAAPVYGLRGLAKKSEIVQVQSPAPEESKITLISPESTQKPELPLPDKVLLEVPFLVQAPFANWDNLHENACEEASLIMVQHYSIKTSLPSQKDGDKEINDLVAFEKSQRYRQSITLSELAKVAKSYFNLENPRVETNISIEDIKRELASGKPVIVPAAGKILPNPFFKNGGPIYHMLVIKGYDEKGFITNDPGIRQGKDFRYTFGAVHKAIHDLNKEDIYSGQKAYLVFD